MPFRKRAREIRAAGMLRIPVLVLLCRWHGRIRRPVHKTSR